VLLEGVAGLDSLRVGVLRHVEETGHFHVVLEHVLGFAAARPERRTVRVELSYLLLDYFAPAVCPILLLTAAL